METLPPDILRDILLWLPLWDISHVSILSYSENLAISDALNVYTPDGRVWWQRKLEKDYDVAEYAQAGNMLPNIKYMFLYAHTTTKIYFAARYEHTEILDLMEITNNPNNVNTEYVSAIELAYILDIAVLNPAVLDVVWRMMLIDDRIPTWDLLYIDRPDAARMLLQYTEITADNLHKIVYDVLRSYAETRDPTTLEMLRDIVSNDKFVVGLSNYHVLMEAVKLRAPESVGVILSVMREDRSGKKAGVDANKGYALYTAAGDGSASIVSMLLAAGANPSINDNRPFRRALKGRHYKILEMLVDDAGFLPVTITADDYRYTQREGKRVLDRMKREKKVVIS